MSFSPCQKTGSILHGKTFMTANVAVLQQWALHFAQHSSQVRINDLAAPEEQIDASWQIKLSRTPRIYRGAGESESNDSNMTGGYAASVYNGPYAHHKVLLYLEPIVAFTIVANGVMLLGWKVDVEGVAC